MKKILAMLLCALLIVSCTAALAEKVGVSMPTKDLQRWNQDGDNMKALLEEAGYEVDLQFANNDVNTQLTQVQTMVDFGSTVLCCTPSYALYLGEAVEPVHKKEKKKKKDKKAKA